MTDNFMNYRFFYNRLRCPPCSAKQFTAAEDERVRLMKLVKENEELRKQIKRDLAGKHSKSLNYYFPWF